jgi:hypothetical protein
MNERKKRMTRKIMLMTAGLCLLFTSSLKAVEKKTAPTEPIFLRRGVEVDLVLKGTIKSRKHPKRDTRIYDLKSFEGQTHGLPRQDQFIAPGINLEDFDETAVKVTVRAKPEATGDLGSTEIVRVLGVEKLDDAEARKLAKQAEAEKVRAFDPSPNALPYSGAWGVRMPLPSAQWPDRLEEFDVNAFAKQVSKLKTASYVILNVTHPANPVHYTGPHPELEKILNTSRFLEAPSFPKRDLLGEALDAVRATGKKTLVYFACEGFHTGRAKDQLQDVWFNYIESQGMTHYEAVRKLILKHYVEKYGSKIDGWWFDGSGGLTKSERLLWRETVHTGNPKAIIAYNRMAGPPFRSSAQCDYFGGHPTPRSRHKFWDEINLPMITAIEAGPWMDTDGQPVDNPGNGALSHVFMGLQDRWTIGKCAFPPQQAIEWTTRVLSAGGMYTWAVPCAGSEMASRQFKLLQKIDKAVENLRKQERTE